MMKVTIAKEHIEQYRLYNTSARRKDKIAETGLPLFLAHADGRAEVHWIENGKFRKKAYAGFLVKQQ